MSELWMFIGTLVFGAVWMLVVPSIIGAARPRVLRLGLRMNGVTGEYADRIIEFDRTGKLPD